MVYVHLAEGFEEIEAITIVDILRRGNIETMLVSVTKEKQVTGSHGILVEADILYEEADYEACQMIVLPGGMPGAKNLGAHDGLTTQLRNFAEQGKYIAAICAAPMVLAALGLLAGKKAVIYPGMESHLKGAMQNPEQVVTGEIEPVSEQVVVDGNIITSKGPATAIPFALCLIDILKGKTVADTLATKLLWKTK